MNFFILGFQRDVLCPKWTPFSNNFLINSDGISDDIAILPTETLSPHTPLRLIRGRIVSQASDFIQDPERMRVPLTAAAPN
jgi:hypothetical protein